MPRPGTRRLSASDAGDALARQEEWEGVNAWPDSPGPGPVLEERRAAAREGAVPEDEAVEGRRRMEWRRRMRESRAMLENLPRGEQAMVEMGGTKTFDDRGRPLWTFPEGGMRR